MGNTQVTMSYASSRPLVRTTLVNIINHLGDRPLTILSLGSGRGELEEALQNAGHIVLGVELSEENAVYARARTVETIVCDAHEFDLRKKFRIVLLSESIGHMREPEILLVAKKHLEKEGRIVITSEVIGEGSRVNFPETLYYNRSKSEISKDINGAGLILERIFPLIVGEDRDGELRKLYVFVAKHPAQPGQESQRVVPEATSPDGAKPRQGKTAVEVAKRFAALKQVHFPGFLPVDKNNIPEWVSQVLEYYRKINPQRAEFLEGLIKHKGRLSFGPDEENVFYGANNQDPLKPVILIATNCEHCLAATLVHEIEALHGRSHEQAIDEEKKFIEAQIVEVDGKTGYGLFVRDLQQGYTQATYNSPFFRYTADTDGLGRYKLYFEKQKEQIATGKGARSQITIIRKYDPLSVKIEYEIIRHDDTALRSEFLLLPEAQLGRATLVSYKEVVANHLTQVENIDINDPEQFFALTYTDEVKSERGVYSFKINKRQYYVPSGAQGICPLTVARRYNAPSKRIEYVFTRHDPTGDIEKTFWLEWSQERGHWVFVAPKSFLEVHLAQPENAADINDPAKYPAFAYEEQIDKADGSYFLTIGEKEYRVHTGKEAPCRITIERRFAAEEQKIEYVFTRDDAPKTKKVFRLAWSQERGHWVLGLFNKRLLIRGVMEEHLGQPMDCPDINNPERFTAFEHEGKINNLDGVYYLSIHGHSYQIYTGRSAPCAVTIARRFNSTSKEIEYVFTRHDEGNIRKVFDVKWSDTHGHWVLESLEITTPQPAPIALSPYPEIAAYIEHCKGFNEQGIMVINMLQSPERIILNMAAQRPAVQEKIIKIISDIPGKILLVGPDRGVVAAALKSKRKPGGREVLEVDASAENIQYARSRNVEAQVVDPYNMGLAAEFSPVWVSEFIGYTNLPRLFQSLASCTALGGYLMITDYEFAAFDPTHDFEKTQYQLHKRWEVTANLPAAGFRLLYIIPIFMGNDKSGSPVNLLIYMAQRDLPRRTGKN
ncbi:MAG: methyltransferase domain-containing protein [Candidatus Omnitrophica bacterium]|nr:methyltransferase domain-containing protein [Candidatus Omnitrophota bacterium]